MSALPRQAWSTQSIPLFAPFGSVSATGPTGPTGPQGVQGNSSGRVYYFNTFGGNVLSLNPLFSPAQQIVVNANGLAGTWTTVVGQPDVVLVPGGNWTFSFNANWGKQPGSTSIPELYVDVYAGATLIATDSATPNPLSLPNVDNDYIFTVAVPPATILSTDQITVEVHIQNLDTINADTVTLYFESDTVAQVITTLGAFSLPGPTGPTGVTGPTGPTGATGPAGSGANASLWATFPAVQSVNMSNFALTNATIINAPLDLSLNAVRDIYHNAETMTLTADQATDLGSFADINLVSQNGNRGRINLTAQPGFSNGIQGEVYVVANGGNVGGISGVSTGGLISLSANTPIGIPTLTSAIKMTGQSIVSYAGVTSPFGSLAGYNFVYGTNGVNIGAGAPPVFPNLIGSVYINGSVGAGGGGGLRVQNGMAIDYIVPFPNPPTNPDLIIGSNAAGQLVQLQGIRSISMAGVQEINNVAKINGSAIAEYYNPNWANNKAITNVDMSGNSLTNLFAINSTPVHVFGSFYSTASQTVAAANQDTTLTLNQNPVGNGMSLNTGAIQVAYPGAYEFTASIQLDKSGGGVSFCDFWFRVNGNDVPDSASQTTIQGTNGEALATVSTIIVLNALDLVNLVFASDDATMTATYFPATTAPPDPYTRPAVPSIIVTVKLLR